MEANAVKAVKEDLPNAIHKVCLFHFTQAIWWRVVSNGLKEDYDDEENATIRSDIQCLMSLPFAPQRDVVKIIIALEEILEGKVMPMSD